MNERRTGSGWRNRLNLALLAFLGVGSYFLWTEHQAHVTEALPWVLILGCLLMHLVMHGMMAGQRMGPGAMAPDTGAMMGRMGMMEQRVNLMQMMMDQMLQQQELMLKKRSDAGS